MVHIRGQRIKLLFLAFCTHFHTMEYCTLIYILLKRAQSYTVHIFITVRWAPSFDMTVFTVYWDLWSTEKNHPPKHSVGNIFSDVYMKLLIFGGLFIWFLFAVFKTIQIYGWRILEERCVFPIGTICHIRKTTIRHLNLLMPLSLYVCIFIPLFSRLYYYWYRLSKVTKFERFLE